MSLVLYFIYNAACVMLLRIKCTLFHGTSVYSIRVARAAKLPADFYARQLYAERVLAIAEVSVLRTSVLPSVTPCCLLSKRYKLRSWNLYRWPIDPCMNLYWRSWALS